MKNKYLKLIDLLSSKYSQEQANHIFRYLFEFVVKKDFVHFLVDENIEDNSFLELKKLINLHINENKPIQYILGEIDFIDSRILVESPILIPRPETEEWVFNLLDKFELIKNEKLKIVEVGTGSGCIAISLAQFFKNSEIFALDINQKALDLAKKNADLNKVENIKFIESDVFSNFNEEVDFIISNPPYISDEQYANLDLSVKNWEDKVALTTSDDGFFVIKKIIENSSSILSDKYLEYPKIILEIGFDQAKKVSKIFSQNNFKSLVLKDYADQDRVCLGYRA